MQFHPFARRLLALVLTAAFMTTAALSGFAVYAMPIQAAYPQESIYLFDADTGEALVEQNPDLPRCVASLTKMMTALLVLESGTDLSAGITIPASLTPELQSIRANRGHTIGLQAGESVRRLDQLAPYGADNPSPVFVLEMAVVEGVYAVSEGKHCRLRLRQGNSSIYAVWFGMHPEQVPYSTGDVVDAAISLSVYDSPRGAQLSGRIIELHPAGLGNTAAEQAALVQALRRGTPLTPEQKESIAPERSHIITVYREVQARRWHAEDLQPLFAKLGEENTGRTLVAISALEQVGLITAADRGGAKFWELVPATGKKNLADAPILKCLEER